MNIYSIRNSKKLQLSKTRIQLEIPTVAQRVKKKISYDTRQDL